MKNRGLFLATVAASMLCPAPGFAQESTPVPPADQSDETTDDASGDIVVTAQRRAQKLQDIGIAISAFSGDALKAQGLSSSADLGRITPGVFVSGSVAGQSSQFSIRGVTQSDFNDAIEAPVAVYVDETYIPSQQGQSLASFDIDRVEVLKGPQGTLFGRNATGGLVHFVVKKPTDQFEGNIDLDYGRFDLFKAEGALSGPLGEGISARVSGLYRRHGKIINNLAPTGGLAPGRQSRSLLRGRLERRHLGSARTVPVRADA